MQAYKKFPKMWFGSYILSTLWYICTHHIYIIQFLPFFSKFVSYFHAKGASYFHVRGAAWPKSPPVLFYRYLSYSYTTQSHTLESEKTMDERKKERKKSVQSCILKFEKIMDEREKSGIWYGVISGIKNMKLSLKNLIKKLYS